MLHCSDYLVVSGDDLEVARLFPDGLQRTFNVPNRRVHLHHEFVAGHAIA